MVYASAGAKSGPGIGRSTEAAMRRILPVLACFFGLTPAMRGEEFYLPDGSPLSGNGGLIIIRQGGQTTVSLGGALFPRMVKTTTAGPEGPVVTRFTLPS